MAGHKQSSTLGSDEQRLSTVPGKGSSNAVPGGIRPQSLHLKQPPANMFSKSDQPLHHRTTKSFPNGKSKWHWLGLI